MAIGEMQEIIDKIDSFLEKREIATETKFHITKLMSEQYWEDMLNESEEQEDNLDDDDDEIDEDDQEEEEKPLKKHKKIQSDIITDEDDEDNELGEDDQDEDDQEEEKVKPSKHIINDEDDIDFEKEYQKIKKVNHQQEIKNKLKSKMKNLKPEVKI